MSLTAALYCRLSRDDGENNESMSIQSQKRLLLDYAKKNKYAIHDFYVDDGYSGTDFERPNFKRMINDIEQGKIKVVIVKDLSRLGRNYLKTGHYLEEYFPEHNVKFIAINDNYTSDEGENELAPFKNIINEWYAKDISKKVRSTISMNQKKGIISGGAVPLFGYRYDEKKNRIVDTETSAIVKRIFKDYISGKTTCQIAKELKNEQVYTPGYYNYLYYKTNEKKYFKNKDLRYSWDSGTVSKILSVKEYNGDLVLHKTQQASFKNHKTLKVPETEQYIFKNKYEAIISDEDIKLVEKIKQRRTRTQIPVERNRYKGLVVCDCCKKVAPLRSFDDTNQKDFYYCHTRGCQSRVFIGINTLDKIISDEIKGLVRIYKKNKDLIMNYAKSYANNLNESSKSNSNIDISQLTERDKKVDLLIEQLFESKMDGSIPESTYTRMLSNYKNEKQEIERRLAKINKTHETNIIKSNIDYVTEINKFMSRLESLVKKEALSYDELNILLSAIVVKKDGRKKIVTLQFNDLGQFWEEFNNDILNK